MALSLHFKTDYGEHGFNILFMSLNVLFSRLMISEHIKFLQDNLTQTSHKWESCEALYSAVESQRIAAESQAKDCESNKQYLQKQL